MRNKWQALAVTLIVVLGIGFLAGPTLDTYAFVHLLLGVIACTLAAFGVSGVWGAVLAGELLDGLKREDLEDPRRDAEVCFSVADRILVAAGMVVFEIVFGLVGASILAMAESSSLPHESLWKIAVMSTLALTAVVVLQLIVKTVGPFVCTASIITRRADALARKQALTCNGQEADSSTTPGKDREYQA